MPLPSTLIMHTTQYNGALSAFYVQYMEYEQINRPFAQCLLTNKIHTRAFVQRQ